MRVLKFGGSSVASPERIQSVIDILKHYHDSDIKFTVVFSAFGGVTDFLIGMGQKASLGDWGYLELLDKFKKRHLDAANILIPEDKRGEILYELEKGFKELNDLLHGVFLVRELSDRTMDFILSFGERNSAFIISHALNLTGVPAAYLDARKIIQTNDNHRDAKVDLIISYDKINNYYSERDKVQVVTGFIGSTPDNTTTTLGRGGSDYTAALLAAGLKAEVIEIWTDVDGVMTADPRKVPKAFTIPTMTYSEAMEMSHFGAKVIYPPTIQPALKKNIPIYIRNTFNPQFEGTLISRKADPDGHPVKGISSIKEVALLTLQGSGLFGVPGISARLFGAIARAKINVIMITQGSSEHSISFAVSPSDADQAKRIVENEFEYEITTYKVEPLKVEMDLTAIAAIGENMRYQPGIAGRMFQSLGKNGVNIVAIAQGSSELNISAVIHKADEVKALNALHEGFFLSDAKVLHVFMVGVGLIGGTLLKQIQEQAEYLKVDRLMEIKLVGLANSKKMAFNEEGLDLADWRSEIDQSEELMNIENFIDQMVEMNLRNSIFIDNTASAEISEFYNKILDNSISISTPNKIATSSSYEQYQLLKRLAQKRNVKFLYETNVGAGLPVLSTLENLMSSGDRILKIEGVLSGSLSFIFNNFKSNTSFSDIVKEAQEKGYTEPDPRTDLSGLDVRRKILILARETGLALEADMVKIENILPQECMDAPTVPEFFEALENNNEHFEKLQSDADAEGKKLRFIAALEDGQATISLKSVDSNHPFYSLSGSDNMIVFTTERYKERPLVVRGPGAGAEVTAAGVFAEIISIGNFMN